MSIIRLETDIAALAGLWPGGMAPRLFPINPVKHFRLMQNDAAKGGKASLNQLRRRLPPDAFGEVQASLGFLLRYGDRVFPGFHCVYKEFVNDEWLALVDYHKGFHRDHVVHQPQVALIAKRILEEFCFSCAAHPLAAAFRTAWWTPLPDAATDTVNLRQLGAFVLARGGEATRYLYDYAVDLGVSPQVVEPCTPVAYWFWHEVLYDACVIGGLFHDIGYPVQFLRTVMGAVGKSRFTELVGGGDASQIEALFDDPLCLMPFRGYQSRRRIARSHAMQADTRTAITRALQGSHGLPGALTFLFLNHEVMDTRSNALNAKGRLTMEMAALGMVMHDMQRIYVGEDKDGKQKGGKPPLTPERPHMRVSFMRDPVSFVLALADTVQSYGRFHADFRLIRKYPVLMLKQQVARAELRQTDRALDIVHFYKQEDAAVRFMQDTEYGPDEQAACFHPQLGFIDYAPLFDRITLRTDWA